VTYDSRSQFLGSLIDFLANSPSFRLSSTSSPAYFDFVYQACAEVTAQGQPVQQFTLAQYNHTFANSTAIFTINGTRVHGAVLVQQGRFVGQLPNGATLSFDYVCPPIFIWIVSSYYFWF
jgi:hypothetical protein